MGDLLVKHVIDSLAIDGEQVTGTVAEKEQLAALPTEIWIKIFKMAIDPDCLCYNRCTSFDFPRFREEVHMLTSSPITAINDQISKIRQVCRLWSRIQEPARKLYVRTNNHLDIGTYTDIRVLSLLDHTHSGDNACKPYPLDQTLLKATRNIHTFIIAKTINPVGNTFIDNFSSYSGYFQNVQSFYHLTKRIPHGFWSQLEVAFPRLRALAIFGSADEVGGSLTLPYLQVLEICVVTPNPPTFSFPSLKHFTSLSLPAYSQQILNTHGHHLESILFPLVGIIPYDFFGGVSWTRFPKLKLFGGLIDAHDGFPPPPIGHPFNHLCLYQEDLERHQLNLESVQKSLSYFPNLHYLTIVKLNSTQAAVHQILLVDQFLVGKGANRLEMYVYGEGLDPELHQLRKDGSWQKETYYPSSRSQSYILTWELKDYSL